jgi:hypothetical protein
MYQQSSSSNGNYAGYALHTTDHSDCSNAVIVGSNHTQGIDVCVYVYSVYVVLCVGSGFVAG